MKVAVVYQDWDNWIQNDFSKFEFWFNKMDRAYHPENTYLVISLSPVQYDFNKKNIRFKSIKSSPLNFLLKLPIYYYLLNKEIKSFNPDVIYSPFIHLITFIKKENQRIIGFLRDKTHEMISAKGGIRILIGWIYSYFNLLAFKKIDLLLHNGLSLEKYANKYTACQKIYCPRKVNIKSYERKKVIKNKILMVNRLTQEKNIELGIRALALMPNFELNIAGCGDLENDLKELAKRLKVMERVNFLGYCDRKTLQSLYESSSLLWLLSKSDFEGSPNVVQEAMITQLPCVVSNVESMKNLVDSKTGILLKNMTENELAKVSRDLIEDETKYMSMVKCAYSKILEIQKKSVPVYTFFKWQHDA